MSIQILFVEEISSPPTKNPVLVWRASSSAAANVLDGVYLSLALKASTVLKCLLGLRNVKRGNFSLGRVKM